MKNDLIKHCRYYNGQDNCKYDDQNKNMLCFYERCWVMENQNGQNYDYLLNEYIYAGLKDFESTDNIPITLKALLFNRY